MIEMKIAGLKGNIEAKLQTIRLSNPLYYYQLKQRYERYCKSFKKSGMKNTIDFISGLEDVLESLDDIIRGYK